jgi:hypothetical protein
MWQRIQTVFLLIVIVSVMASIFLPIWISTDLNKVLYPLHYSVLENNTTVAVYFPYCITGILLVAAATVAVIQIGKFKNRILQVKLGALNSLFIALALGSTVYFGQKLIQQFGGTYGFGLWLPAIAALCNWLALRFIRKDERLVRDSDRLR